MRYRVLALAGALFVSAIVVADPPPSSTAAAQKAITGVNQRVTQNQAEVAHLQQDVSQQESASQQAAERLQQQDRTIEELKRELKAAQDASNKPAAGH